MDTPVHNMTRPLASFLVSLYCVCLAGCAAWSNPVANGIPVRLLPPELLAKSKDELETIPLTLLRQKPPDVYRLAAGDLLGIYIEGVLGQEDQLPPVNFPQSPELPPSIGYPILVREDGTLPLPLVNPVHVDGMTVGEAEESVKKAYTVDKQVLLIGEERILVTMIRPRQTRVLVIREDSPSARVDVRTPTIRGFGRSARVTSTSRRGTGWIVNLPAYENDVLTALAQTGGLPGTDAVNEVIIQRGYKDAGASGALRDQSNNEISVFERTSSGREVDTVRIPLRIRPGEPPPFKPDDIILNEGDIVFIKAREAQFYYTAGVLPSQEVPIPRDYDLTVVEAIARINGPLFNGGVNTNNLSGNIVAPGMGNPSPSLLIVLRKTPGGAQVAIRVDLNRAVRDARENIVVQAGDVLVLQEAPREAFARYFKDVTNFFLLSNVINRTDTTGTTTISVP